MNRTRLLSMVRKEFTQMRRDRATLRMLFAIPVMQVLLFGYAVRTDVRNLPTAVFDQSHTQESRALVQRLANTGNFVVKHVATSYDEAEELIRRGLAKSAVIVPEDYARRLKRGRSVAVQVLVDATDPTASESAIGAAQLVGQGVNLELANVRLGLRDVAPPLEMRVRPLYNPALKSSIFIVPGIIGMILSNILIIVTAMAIVREREYGTLEQLIVTPLTRSEIMLGKIVPYVFVGYFQMTAVLTLGHFLFHVPIRGSLLTIYALSFLFITANLGLGLFISTLARTQAAAMQSSFFFLLPNVLLSGFMFPREAMPTFAKWLGLALPLTYYLQLLRGVVLKGAGIAELWPQALALVAFASLFFFFSVRRFQKTLE